MKYLLAPFSLFWVMLLSLWEFLRGRPVIASERTQVFRRSKCSACPHLRIYKDPEEFEAFRCSECLCDLDLKIPARMARCPLSKW